MTYRVLNNERLNMRADTTSDYASMVESALNSMEDDGFTLVAIEQPADENGEPYYIFHKQD